MPYLTPDAPPEGEYYCRTVLIPRSPEFLALFDGALDQLAKESNYEQFGDLTPEETAYLWLQAWVGQSDAGSECVEPGVTTAVDVFYHRLNQGTAGGGITANTETKIPFNVAGEHNAGNVALATNQFTVQPGKYWIEMEHLCAASSTYLNVQIYLQGGSAVNDYFQMTYLVGQNIMRLAARRVIDIPIARDVEFRVLHGTTVATNFFGTPANRSGFLENYGWVSFLRIGDAS